MSHNSKLRLKSLGIDTYTEPVIYMRADSDICKSEGFQSQARIQICLKDRSLIATLNKVQSSILHRNEASLSNYAWNFLEAEEGDEISVFHPQPLESLSYIRSKIFGNTLKTSEINQIISDLVSGQLADVPIAMLLAASAGNRLSKKETYDFTQAMVNTGARLSWPAELVVDKHCVGGLPGNRTTLIVVPIVAAFGLMIPKTSSRAITSPAGTADTMEVFAPVNLDIKTMQKVVERENGCIVWGGAVALSPADDLLIRIEKIMDIDSEEQLVASILSKKIAAGSNHLLIDIPVGATAKIRSIHQAELIRNSLRAIGEEFSLKLNIVFTDGSQPVGRGIGPVLEAKDVLAVLSGDPRAPQDLKERALSLAGHILEFSNQVAVGSGKSTAKLILESGQALKKFEAICRAQGGGLLTLSNAPFTHEIAAEKSGTIVKIDNRIIARIAKLAGAPLNPTSGVELLVKLGMRVEKGQPLFIIHAEAKGELSYALAFINLGHSVVEIEDD